MTDAPSDGYPWPSSPAVTSVMRGNRKRDTRPELALRSELHRRGLRYRTDYPVRVEGGRPIRVDIAFTRLRLAVLVDGCFWHACPEHGVQPRANASYWGPKLTRNVERDRQVDAALAEIGWSVIRVWEHEAPKTASDRVTAEAQRLGFP